jgi:hypothetical protein
LVILLSSAVEAGKKEGLALYILAAADFRYVLLLPKRFPVVLMVAMD